MRTLSCYTCVAYGVLSYCEIHFPRGSFPLTLDAMLITSEYPPRPLVISCPVAPSRSQTNQGLRSHLSHQISSNCAFELVRQYLSCDGNSGGAAAMPLGKARVYTGNTTPGAKTVWMQFCCVRPSTSAQVCEVTQSYNQWVPPFLDSVLMVIPHSCPPNFRLR